MSIRTVLLAVLLPLAALVGCNKTATTVAPVPQAIPTATPRLYKLGEPRPIVLNADKPIVVKAATPEPSVKH